MKILDKIAIAFGLACLAWACSGCSATALSASEPAAHSTQRWGDLRSGHQLGDNLVADAAPGEPVACAGRPDEASCYRAAYRAATERARVLAAQPFAAEAYAEPFAPEESPAPGSQAMAEQIREGEAISAIHEVEERMRAAVQP